MTRVTSERIRQFFIKPGGSPAAGITPDTIQLFNADGTPYSPGGVGGSADAMVWAGEWDVDTAYSRYEVVRYDEHLYTAKAINVLAGTASPTNIVLLPPDSYIADYGPFVTARGLVDGGVILEGDGSTDEVFFFDISTDDTVVIDDIVDDQISTIDFYGPDGESLDIDPSYESGSQDPLTLTDLESGRYYMRVSRYNPPVLPGTPEFTVNPTIPGILADYSDNWELML